MVTPNRTQVDTSEIHDILRNSRRRAVLEELEDEVKPVSLRELSEEIAARETDQSPPPRDARSSVYNSLHQTHLPKLDDAGVIEYDPDRKTARLQDPARDVDLYMEVVTRYGITWAQFYRTLGVIGLTSIVAANTGVVLFSEVPTLAFTVFFLVIFAVATAYQLWSRRWFYFRSIFSGE